MKVSKKRVAIMFKLECCKMRIVRISSDLPHIEVKAFNADFQMQEFLKESGKLKFKKRLE